MECAVHARMKWFNQIVFGDSEIAMQCRGRHLAKLGRSVLRPYTIAIL
jgi:hypothetical protein